MLGIDPEFYIRNRRTGKALSAHRLIGDGKINNGAYPNKAHGRSVTSELDRDGAALEVRNTLVTPCRDYLVPYVAQSVQLAYKELVKKYGNSKYEFHCGPVFELGDLRGPADIREFGCRPDVNAYTMEDQNPTLPKGERRRFTGGHIHRSGLGTLDAKNAGAVAVIMDALIGLPMVAMLGYNFANGEAERREFYGKAGSYRYDTSLKKIEYRTLSGRLLLHPTILTWALGVAKTISPALSAGNYTSMVRSLSAQIDIEDIRRTINEHDVAAAEALYNGIYDTYYGSHNAYFKNQGKVFQQFVDLIVEANHRDVYFDDDMLVNWQLYPDNHIKDHQYIGMHTAIAGAYDEIIFPQRPFIRDVFGKAVFIHDEPSRFHYTSTVNKAAALKKARGF